MVFYKPFINVVLILNFIVEITIADHGLGIPRGLSLNIADSEFSCPSASGYESFGSDTCFSFPGIKTGYFTALNTCLSSGVEEADLIAVSNLKHLTINEVKVIRVNAIKNNEGKWKKITRK